jgi:tetratricopeptide (TPR) repeat protein
MTRGVTLAALLLCCGLGCGRAASSDTELRQLLERATEAYARALETVDGETRVAAFQEAERLYASAARSAPPNPDLYANQGNAALQGQRLGAAVLAYRRALAIDPDHSRALQNLALARALLPEWVPRPESRGSLDSFFLWQRGLTRAERRGAAAASFACAALLLALWLRTDQIALRNLALLPAAAWVAWLGSLAIDASARDRDEVVVTAPDVRARAADSERAPALLADPLPDGTEARILEVRSPWVRIRLANGRDAWVPESALTRVNETAS